jgi:5-(carboxyamino)imidazole ribonucleotide synthase
MLNLIGEEGQSGPVLYQGLREVLAMKAVYVHLYGKNETKPGRKMGHITLLDENKNALTERAGAIKKMIRVVSGGTSPGSL